MADLIRWNDTPAGSTGQFGPFTFIVSPLYTGEGYLLVPYIPGMKDRRARGALAEVKATAETWLREFVSSLGALFATDLREHLTVTARTEQSLGEQYSEMPGEDSRDRANQHLGAARVCRALIKLIEHGLV